MTSGEPEVDRPELLAYLGRQRWFGGVPDTARITAVRPYGWLSDPLGGVGVRFELVTVEQVTNTVTYNVPLSYRSELDEELGYGLVGIEHWAEGEFFVYDALHDPQARAIIVRGFETPPTSSGLRYERLGAPLEAPEDTTMLAAEQSNTSVIVDGVTLLKVFRKIAPGRNPDIEILRALTLHGSEDVPALHGWIGSDDPECDLAMLGTFLRTATDGWDSARASFRDLVAEDDLAADEAGGDFAADSERLGATTAQVHAQMAELLPATTWRRGELQQLADRLRARLEEALAVVPTLAEHAVAAQACYDAVVDDGSVPAQRVHGDLHLGQTLRTTHGWKLIDFEGEPAKPVTERVRLDSPLRDVAGMLRSLDYAAHSVLLQTGVDDARAREQAEEWVSRNREAFLRGYGFDDSPAAVALLTAYELDKAVYEVVYEVQHRPEWADIPTRAVERLTRPTS